MKLIVGLGNIGDKYTFTRHNAGFMVLDSWALSENISFKQESKFKAFIAKIKYNSEDIILVKPTTYMNLSGEAVIAICNFYKIKPEDILVIFDDLSIDLGKLRFRANGSDGGHNGIKSIIQQMGTKEIKRLKFGIGPQPPIPSEAFVLQNFSSEQLPLLKESLNKAVDAVKFFLESNDIQKTQNKYN